MRVGDRRLRVGPHLAYRAQGVSGLIPPNAKLVFEVELLALGYAFRLPAAAIRRTPAALNPPRVSQQP
jgi:hypothetical protein